MAKATAETHGDAGRRSCGGCDRAGPSSFSIWGATVTELRRDRVKRCGRFSNLTAMSKLRNRGTQHPGFNQVIAPVGAECPHNTLPSQLAG